MSVILLIQASTYKKKNMLIDITIEKVKGLLSFFSKYREFDFANALESAKKCTEYGYRADISYQE
jgi:hypothetical protein